MKPRRLKKWILPTATAMLNVGLVAHADLRMPALFSDHMVLQADQSLPVWGWAAPGDRITVAIADQVQSATADPDGKWRVLLEPLRTGDVLRMTVETSLQRLTVEDIRVGEVWLCAGQSNMAMSLSGVRDAQREIASATFPEIRFFSIPSHPAATPQDNVEGQWVVCSPGAVRRFSAVAFLFGREVHQRLSTPVGLIVAAEGGTLIEAWLSFEALDTLEAFQPVMDRLRLPEDPSWDAPAALTHYEQMVATWRDATAHPDAPALRKPHLPVSPRLYKNVPGNLFNGMIHPLAPFGLRGVIWYQGETDAFLPSAPDYGKRLTSLVQDWRQRWEFPLPFAWVQLPEFSNVSEIGRRFWPEIRDQMRRSLSLPHTGMAIGLGSGDPDDIHPADKLTVAQRLAAWALAEVYVQPDVVVGGPRLVSATPEDGAIRLTFRQTDEGLVARGGILAGFEVAAADRQWEPGRAVIDGKTVIVSHPGMDAPAAVRYAWADVPDWSLLNGDGMPASPFRTDDWPIVAPRSVPDRELNPAALVHVLDTPAITVDGRLDEDVWRELPAYTLRDLTHGTPPEHPTTFRLFWSDKALYLGIHCADSDPEGIRVGTPLHGDAAIWDGDVVEILLETADHAYYQIVINPAGAVVSLDRGYGIITDGVNRLWLPDAEIATHPAQDGWQLEIRIPVRPPVDPRHDPLRGVVGRPPVSESPWFFNVCRLRIREGGVESSAFAPTKSGGFHNMAAFGKLLLDMNPDQ